MIKKRYVIAALGVVSVLLGSLLYSSVILAQSGSEYDPWLDYNEDGIVDVNDLHSLGQVYSSSGDPTKNVTVTNWPISRDVTVWSDETVSYPDKLYSPISNASGFGQLHVLMAVEDIEDPGQELTIYIEGLLWNSARTYYWSIKSYIVVFSITLWAHNVSIPVPSETFRFVAWASTPTTSARVNLSYYLTWS